MKVHQLIPSLWSGDATGQAAIHYQMSLRRLGLYGEIYAGEVGPGLSPLARPVSELKPGSSDLVLYHHGISSYLAGKLLHLPGRHGLVYHNITPARFYAGTSMSEALVGGRAQLSALAPDVELALADSPLNASELVASGYRNVHVVPLFIEPARFRPEAADPLWMRRLQRNVPTLFSVSRVLPHKRFEGLLRLHAEFLHLCPQARLIIAGGFQPGGEYFRQLQAMARGLDGVLFLGRLSHAQLVAAYRTSSAFVSMSEHEGFGVPLLEAMASELPILAYAAGAVAQTLGGSGIAFTEKRFAFLAELLKELHDNEALRKRIVQRQSRRLAELSSDAALKSLRGALDGALRPTARRRRGSGRPRVGFVVQRYGPVIGGSESLARQLAHRLSSKWQITVLTTCARDHLTWANEFPPGFERDGAVRVLRFSTDARRNLSRFNRLSRTMYRQENDRISEELWIAEQGPRCSGLLQHLGEQAASYDGFVVFTYLYAPAVWGLPMIARKTIFVPTAHDEPPLRFGLFDDVFELPKVLMCLTPEERRLIERRFPRHARIVTAGVGVDFPPVRPDRFRRKYGLNRPYLFYVGRLERGKGLPELLRHYAELRNSGAKAPELVLAGSSSMRIGGDGVRHLGRISEQEKFDGIAGAAAVVIPSRYESLSLLALEAFAQQTPILVNAESEVLSGQVRRSGGGVAYRDRDSFLEGVSRILRTRAKLGANGFAFAKKQRWPQVVERYEREMERILKDNHEVADHRNHRPRVGGSD